MITSFIPRAAFPTLDSLPRSYYLGHHAAGLQKMRTLLNQIDFIIECRDYRIPLTSRNPMFEEVLEGSERMIVYTKKDLGSSGDKVEDGKVYTKYTILPHSCICIDLFALNSYTPLSVPSSHPRPSCLPPPNRILLSSP